MVTLLNPEDPPEPCTTGYGNCPPARKLACFPDSVRRFGSARISRTFFSCSALMKTSRLMSGRKIATFNNSLIRKSLPDVFVVLVLLLDVTDCVVPTEGGEN